MRIHLILITLLIISCSSNPTKYEPEKKDKGYSDKTIENDLRVSTFQGNSATKKESAELYAKFRAMEVCQELGRPYTHLLLVKDKTFSKEISQTSYVGPYYGMAPYYGRYGGYSSGMTMNYGSASTTTSNETYTYPLFEVYFECVDKALDARISLTNLSFSQLKTLVKDLKGAVQIDEILSDSPNKGKLQKADIITKIGGERISTVLEAYHAARKNSMNNVEVEFFRNGDLKKTTASFANVSNLVIEAQNEIIKEACKMDEIKEKSPLCKK